MTLKGLLADCIQRLEKSGERQDLLYRAQACRDLRKRLKGHGEQLDMSVAFLIEECYIALEDWA